MLVDIHDNDICGITLYIYEGLSDEDADRLANSICEEAKTRMKEKRRFYGVIKNSDHQ